MPNLKDLLAIPLKICSVSDKICEYTDGQLCFFIATKSLRRITFCPKEGDGNN